MEVNTTRRRSSAGRLLASLLPRYIPKTITETIDLSSLEIDLLVAYQLSLPDPLFLGPLAFQEARLVTSGDLSSRIRDVLFKVGIINPPPKDHDGSYMPVDTSKITRNLVNQLYFCTALVTRRVVSLLFVFEEQCDRLRMLDNEQRELETLLANPPAGFEEELRLRLQSVHQRRAIRPSQQVVMLAGPDVLPAYS